jgi:CheY-like chemotaxis protein
MKVLVAEDDPVSRRILEKLLTNQGCTTTICNDGRQAWEVYQEGDYRLIISDWMMPEIDGLELVRRIREINRPEYCYFVLLTAMTGKTNFLAAMDAGVDDYLTKPLDADEIKVRLRVARRILDLQRDIQILRGTLPICAWCKRIRDDDRLWHSVEEYLSSHTEADFSHSICPQCEQTHFAGLRREPR